MLILYASLLMQARITGRLKPLLEHSEGEVRARACNVVGNLCRYNVTFYEPILEAGLIEVLIDRCRDYDRGTRKFATFAIGNAGKAPASQPCHGPAPTSAGDCFENSVGVTPCLQSTLVGLAIAVRILLHPDHRAKHCQLV